jgi:hypothetical protein
MQRILLRSVDATVTGVVSGWLRILVGKKSEVPSSAQAEAVDITV